MLLRRKSHQTSILVCFTVRLKAFVGLGLAVENSGKSREAGRGKMKGRKAATWAAAQQHKPTSLSRVVR